MEETYSTLGRPYATMMVPGRNLFAIYGQSSLLTGRNMALSPRLGHIVSFNSANVAQPMTTPSTNMFGVYGPRRLPSNQVKLPSSSNQVRPLPPVPFPSNPMRILSGPLPSMPLVHGMRFTPQFYGNWNSVV